MAVVATLDRPVRWPGGQRLRSAREARGLSIKALAAATGLTPQTIRHYESGQRGPSAPALLALAQALHMPPDQLWPTGLTALDDVALALAGPAEKERWSVSKLTSYLMCPARFYLQYESGDPETAPSSVDAVIGSITHAGIESLNRARMGQTVPPPFEAMKAAAATHLSHVPSDPENGGTPDPQTVQSEAERLYALYAAEIAPAYQPALIEQRTEVEIAGVTFTAVLDVTTTDGWVRDTKTAKRRPSQSDIDDNLQATVYTLAYRDLLGEKPQGVAFDYLIRNKTPVAMTYTTTRSQRDFDRLARIVEGVTEAVAAGRFYPNPMSKFGCAGCPFRQQCREMF